MVGNPCNTNAMIAMENAPNIPRKNFHALTRLDENRAKAQLAIKSQSPHTAVTNLCIWGNHSTTQVRRPAHPGPLSNGSGPPRRPAFPLPPLPAACLSRACHLPASRLQVPDFVNARINGVLATDVITDRKWLEETFVPTVAQRGGALIKKWGKSSAASTAVSVCDAIRSLVGTAVSSVCVGDGLGSRLWR